MLTKNLLQALNDQVNKEYYSSYMYLSIAAYAKSIDLDGLANFFNVQTQEENFHAMKIYNYILDRGGNVTLKAIDAPPVEFKSVIEIFEITLEHEKLVTKSINDLMDIAIKENDHACISFLKWFVDEQVEEEANVSRILNRLKLIGGEGHGLLMIDSELAARTFIPSATSE
jgi:ferritin